MSSRIFQGVVTQLSEAAGLPLGVLDTDGIVISASDTALIGEKWPDAVNAIAAMPDAPPPIITTVLILFSAAV